MKNHLYIAAIAIIALALSACAHQNAGIRVYGTAITKTDKGGEKSKSHLIASISGDVEAVSSIEAGPVRLVFQPGGKFIASKVIKAQGEGRSGQSSRDRTLQSHWAPWPGDRMANAGSILARGLGNPERQNL